MSPRMEDAPEDLLKELSKQALIREIIDLRTDLAAQVETSARLIEETIAHYPRRPDTRMALAIAARTVRRGRHLTEAEKLENLRRAMVEEDEATPSRAEDRGERADG